MTPTNLINYSTEIWRKLTFSSRSVLYLWLDTTQHNTHIKTQKNKKLELLFCLIFSCFTCSMFSLLFRNTGRLLIVWKN